MRYVPALLAAVSATVVCSLAQAQTVVWTENFDDGAAAGRFTVNKLLPASGFNTETVDFAYNYGAFNYNKYSDPSTFVPTPIPAAPGSTSTIGVKMQLSGLGAHLAILPNGVTVGGDFKIEGYLWGNYNGGPGDQFATQGGTGSTEYMTTGLNRGGTTGVTGIFPAATTPALGYDFAATIEGGGSSDYRISTTDAGDDGAGSPKRNAAWPGAFNENRFTLSNGDLILSPPGDAAGVNVRDLVDNQANSYYRSEVFPNSAGFEVAGAPAKKWVPFVVEQHGRIAAYSLNGKIISVLFNNAEDYAGTPQIGYADRNAGVAAEAAVTQFALFDNLSASTLPDASQNSISASNAFAEIKTSGTYPVASAVSLTGLVMDIPESEATQTSTVSGAGALNFNGGYAAVLASRGTHTVSAPVNFNADTSIMVGAGSTSSTTADSTVLEMSNVNYANETVVTKLGQGTLKVNRIRAKAFNNWAGKTVVTGAGQGSASKITNLDMYNVGTSPNYLPGATLDIGRTVLAIDYVKRNSANPAQTNSPLVGGYPTPLISAMLNAGFAVDTVNTDPRGPLPTWAGRGITTSAPEVVGAGFYDSAFVVRLFEASMIGYTETPQAYGNSGFDIDGSTVLVGFTFKADFDFDQDIDFDDLVTLAQNYGMSDKFWYEGNATADGALGAAGIVDFDDLVMLAQRYGSSIGTNGAIVVDMAMAASFESDWLLAQSLVPEPTSLAALGMGAAAMVRRRR